THPQQAGATAHTVSAYLLHASADEFPQLTEGSLALTQTDGTNALMWQQGAHLYALVAQLPLDTLETLARYLED
ncbi:MAG: hypothetical protein AAF289_15525, partial [Cyanobacteria bacterium P01_A01_bin.135]